MDTTGRNVHLKSNRFDFADCRGPGLLIATSPPPQCLSEQYTSDENRHLETQRSGVYRYVPLPRVRRLFLDHVRRR